MKREYEGSRHTKETQIDLSLNFDTAQYKINTSVGFLDHMLELFAHHGNFGLKINTFWVVKKIDKRN